MILTLGAEPDIASNPTDIVLILDRSGSMTQSQETVLRFTVTHLGLCQGLLPVNESIDYQDDQDQTPDFGDPRIQVDCGGVWIPHLANAAAQGLAEPMLSGEVILNHP